MLLQASILGTTFSLNQFNIICSSAFCSHYCHWKIALESHLFLGELIFNHLYLVVLIPHCSSQPDNELLEILIENCYFLAAFSPHFDRIT